MSRLVLEWSVRRGVVHGARSGAVRHLEREGLSLRLRAPGAATGQGEASPLPGYSPDTLPEVITALEQLPVNSLPVPERAMTARELLSAAAGCLAPLPASGRFAVETALLDLLGQVNGEPLWASLLGNPLPPPDVPLCDLVGGTDTAGVAGAAARSPATTVKVKILGPALGAQLGTLQQIRDALGGRALRLDANGTLGGPELNEDLARLGSLGPELVEEPADPIALRRALGGLPCPFPVALDESLQHPDAWPSIAPHLAALGVRAVVLKPMALGGIARCLELAAAAQDRGLHVTVSHLFDGPIALAAACQLALAIGSRQHASGLTRHGGLLAWPQVGVPGLGDTHLAASEGSGLGLSLLPEAS